MIDLLRVLKSERKVTILMHYCCHEQFKQYFQVSFMLQLQLSISLSQIAGTERLLTSSVSFAKKMTYLRQLIYKLVRRRRFIQFQRSHYFMDFQGRRVTVSLIDCSLGSLWKEKSGYCQWQNIYTTALLCYYRN